MERLVDVPAALAWFDRSGTPLTGNRRWRTLLGTPSVSGAAWVVAWDYALEQDDAAATSWRKGVRGLTPFELLLRIRTVHGDRSIRARAEPDCLSVSADPASEPEHVGWMVGAWDVTTELALRAAWSRSEERAAGLERRQLQLADLAHRDLLTSLANRRMLTLALEQRLQAEEPTAVLFVVVDDFTTINDRFGHHVGDEVLMAIAGRLGSGLRAVDLAARYAGDEFVVLCPPWSARVVAERLAASLCEPVELPDGGDVHLQVSIGVAVTASDAGADQILRRAHRAMYLAKRGGKGQVVFFDAM